MHDKIIVYSSYRSGSTMFCEYLSKKYNKKNLNEYFHNQIKLRTYVPNNCIIKIMPDHNLPKWFSEKTYNIRLRRKDIVKQIASMYIADYLAIWQNNQSNEFIKIVPHKLENTIRYIYKLKNILDNYSINFDEDLYYEDLNISNVNSKINIKPVNYQDIIFEIKHLIQKLKLSGR